MSSQIQRVYLAGKVSKSDWRHHVVKDLRDSLWMEEISHSQDQRAADWPVTPNGIAPNVHFTGPYFVSCDHGCSHGSSSHGLGDGCSIWHGSENRTVELCEKAIAGSTVLFAWLDDLTAFGTLVEIGYAKGRGVRVIVACPPSGDARVVKGGDSGLSGDKPEIWFAMAAADIVIEAPTPTQALKKALETLS